MLIAADGRGDLALRAGGPLTEALNSYWLVIHVVSAIIATGAFTLGGLCSVLYLVKARKRPPTTGYLARVPEPAALDRIAYRCTRSRSRCGRSRC